MQPNASVTPAVNFHLQGEEEAKAQKQRQCAHSHQAGSVSGEPKRNRTQRTQVKADSFFNFFDPPTIPDDPKAEVDEDTQVSV